jgi:hypothetical protein
LLGTPDDVLWFSEQVNSGNVNYDAVLTDNIDLSNRNFTPIGNNTPTTNRYTGVFDGAGKKITVNIDTTADNQGVFGYVDSGGEIKNLTVEGAVTGGRQVGGIVGYLNGGTLKNVTNRAKITSENTSAANLGVGGIAGHARGVSTIEDASNHGDVSSNRNAGGIVGRIDGTLTTASAVENVVNYGNVSASNLQIGGIAAIGSDTMFNNAVNYGNVSGTGASARKVGGVIGYLNYRAASPSSTMTNLVNAGKVKTVAKGDYGVGGIIGDLLLAANIHLRDCYNTGDVTGNLQHVGGIIGKNGETKSVVDSCYNTGDVTGDEGALFVGGIVGSNKGTVQDVINIGVVSTTSGSIGGISGNTTGTFTGSCYYLAVAARNGTDIGTSCSDEELLPIIKALFPGSTDFEVLKDQVYKTKIVLKVYSQVGKDGAAVNTKSYTMAQLDELADIKGKAGYLLGYRMYRTANAVTLERLLGDAAGAAAPFVSDAKYVLSGVLTGAGIADDERWSKDFTYDDLTVSNMFFPATATTGTSSQSVATSTRGAYEVKPALAMTAAIDPIPAGGPAAGEYLAAWNGDIDPDDESARSMQFLLGTSETNYLAKLSDASRFPSRVDSITVIRHADETLAQIAERLVNQEQTIKENEQTIEENEQDIEDLRDQIDELTREMRQKDIDNELQKSSESEKAAAEKARLESEQAAKEAQTAELQKQTAELKKQTEELQKQLNASKRQVFKSAAVKIISLKAGKRSATIRWKKTAEAQSYEIVYAANKGFKSKKTVTVKGANAVKRTIRSLTEGKTYYFKVRALTTISGKAVKSKYSPVKKLKI